MERLAVAFETIAETLAGMLDIQQQRFAKEFPERVARNAKITHIPNEEERLREEQGGSDRFAPIADWIGSREEQFLKEQAGAKKRSRTRKTRHQAGDVGGES